MNATPERKGHVAEDRIAIYLDRHMTAGERREFQDHLSTCADCRAAVLEAARVLGAGRRKRRRYAVGALVAAAAVAAVMLLPSRDPTPNPVRAGGSGELAGLVVVREWAGTPETEPVFVWRPVDNALQYRFELVTTNGEAVWDTTVTDTTVTIPSHAVAEAGVSVLWVVDALSSDGSSTSTGYQPLSITRQ